MKRKEGRVVAFPPGPLGDSMIFSPLMFFTLKRGNDKWPLQGMHLGPWEPCTPAKPKQGTAAVLTVPHDTTSEPLLNSLLLCPIFVPPQNSYVELLMLEMMVIVGETFGRCLCRGALMNGNSAS